MPGHPFDARAAGCNMLIRDGAMLVRGADDVIEALRGTRRGPWRTPPASRAAGPAPERRSLAGDLRAPRGGSSTGSDQARWPRTS